MGHGAVVDEKKNEKIAQFLPGIAPLSFNR